MFHTMEELEVDNIGYKEAEELIHSILLTGNKDIHYNILLHMDIKEINRYCKVNTAGQKMCNNKNFWINKIKYDDLPIHLISDINMNTTKFDFIALYKLLEDVKFISETTLVVNSIEATRKELKTSGIINIDLIKQSYIKEVLPVDIFNQITVTSTFCRISLKYTNIDSYDINIYMSELGQDIFKNVYNGKINYDDTIYIIQKSYFNTFIGNTIAIMDDQRVSFFMNNLRKIDLTIARNQNVNINALYRRLSIWDTIKFLKKFTTRDR